MVAPPIAMMGRSLLATSVTNETASFQHINIHRVFIVKITNFVSAKLSLGR
jgi:hypothetical protein